MPVDVMKCHSGGQKTFQQVLWFFFFPIFFTASRTAPHVAPPPGIVEIDSEKFACQW